MVRKRKKKRPWYSPFHKSNGSGAQSNFEKVEEFNGQFADMFNKNEHSQLSPSSSFHDNICVYMEGVAKLLKGLNPSKAFGSNELHPRVPKGLGPVFAHRFQ